MAHRLKIAVLKASTAFLLYPTHCSTRQQFSPGSGCGAWGDGRVDDSNVAVRVSFSLKDGLKIEKKMNLSRAVSQMIQLTKQALLSSDVDALLVTEDTK